MRLAARMERIGTETAFEAAARARALEATGRDVIHLEIGEPDFDTPANIREAAKRALDEGWTHYPPAPGLPQLREAIAADASARKRFPVDPERVIVTPGAKPIMFFALLVLADAGDEVIYPDPGFPIYESMTRYVGATAVPLPIRQENGFRLDPDELASLVTPRTRLVVFNSPANPTGGVLSRDDLERIADVARERDLIVLADEIYSRIVYEGEHVSIASLPGMAERTIVLDGFSKTYAMTGWRLGYGIVPEPLVAPFTRLIINSVSGTSAHSQVAAVEALTRWSRNSVPAGVSSSAGSMRSPASAACSPPARSTSSRTYPGRACRARSWQTACSSRPACPCWPERHSDRSDATTFESAMPTRRPTLRRLSSVSGPLPNA